MEYEHEFIKFNNFIILLNTNKHAKTTLVESYINNGAVDENRENLGISHLLEHICTDGWGKCRNNCSEFWKKRGVVLNASTGQTYVNYFIKGLPKYMDDMIDYIVSISTNPIINKNRIKKEKKAVTNELLIHGQNSQLPLYNLLNQILFTVPGLQFQDDIQHQIKNLVNLNATNLAKWSKEYYGSGNTIISISGDFHKKTVLTKLKKKLKKYTKYKTRTYYRNVFAPGLKVGYVENKMIDNTTVFFAFHSPIFYKDLETYYIDFFKEFINSGMTSILMYELREKRDLIYNIQLDNYTTPYGTYILIETSCKNNNIERAVKRTIKTLQKLSEGKFSSRHMEYVRESYLVQKYNDCENNDFISNFYGEQYINQLFNLQNPLIISPSEMIDKIKELQKPEFVGFIKKLLIFSNVKIAYQGKREVKDLEKQVLKIIK
jgi:predicted Zn-dependent peptidase